MAGGEVRGGHSRSVGVLSAEEEAMHRHAHVEHTKAPLGLALFGHTAAQGKGVTIDSSEGTGELQGCHGC